MRLTFSWLCHSLGGSRYHGAVSSSRLGFCIFKMNLMISCLRGRWNCGPSTSRLLFSLGAVLCNTFSGTLRCHRLREIRKSNTAGPLGGGKLRPVVGGEEAGGSQLMLTPLPFSFSVSAATPGASPKHSVRITTYFP